LRGKKVKVWRVQKTEALFRDVLTSLIREKAYDAIVVQEILDRANVGRSTFYTHFRDKDELLASSIQEMLRFPRSMPSTSSVNSHERIIRFSLPIFQYLQEHRDKHLRSGHGTIDAKSRALLVNHVGEDGNRNNRPSSLFTTRLETPTVANDNTKLVNTNSTVSVMFGNARRSGFF
jgi:AcrR family transcriptional regulator